MVDCTFQISDTQKAEIIGLTKELNFEKALHKFLETLFAGCGIIITSGNEGSLTCKNSSEILDVFIEIAKKREEANKPKS